MKNNNNSCCCIITIISALICAIGIAGIFYAGVLTAVTPFAIITLVLGILGFLYVIITNICGNKNCKIIDKLCFAPTIVGSIIIPIIIIPLETIATGLISTAALIGALGFFLILSFINLLQLLFSFLCNNKCDNYID